MSNSEIRATPGTLDSYDVTQYLVPGANLIFVFLATLIIWMAARPAHLKSENVSLRRIHPQ